MSRIYKVKILISDGSTIPPTSIELEDLTSKELEDAIIDYLWKQGNDIHDMCVDVE